MLLSQIWFWYRGVPLHRLIITENVAGDVNGNAKHAQFVTKRCYQFNGIIQGREFWTKHRCLYQFFSLIVPDDWGPIAENEDPSHRSPSCLISGMVCIYEAIRWHTSSSGLRHIHWYGLLCVLVEAPPVEFVESFLWDTWMHWIEVQPALGEFLKVPEYSVNGL